MGVQVFDGSSKRTKAALLKGPHFGHAPLYDAVFDVFCAAAERKGEREEMQDAHVVAHDLWALDDGAAPDAAPRAAVFAVFDGHAGARASLYAAQHVPRLLRQQLVEWHDMGRRGVGDGMCFGVWCCVG